MIYDSRNAMRLYQGQIMRFEPSHQLGVWQTFMNYLTNAWPFIVTTLSCSMVVGVISGALTFIFLWPKTPKEGFWRLVVAGISSHVFGNAVLRTITHFFDWIPAAEIQTGARMLAAFPGWWGLGILVHYFSKTENQDIKEIIDDWKKPT